MILKLSTYIVDSFTNEPFKGNPAGVCLLDAPLDSSQMLNIARELGLSETAFVQRLPEQEQFSIRYFSPKMEIPLCGHATIAAAKCLFHQSPDSQEVHFVNRDGLDIKVGRTGQSLLMDFPIYQTRPIQTPEKLLLALGIDMVEKAVYNEETRIILLEITDPELLRGLTPDAQSLLKAHQGINGVLITAPSHQPIFDFESRYFWPWSGTLEDPVTGGTHTFLAPYWAQKLGKTELNSFQCSARTGQMKIQLFSDHLCIIGEAVIVFEGNLNL